MTIADNPTVVGQTNYTVTADVGDLRKTTTNAKRVLTRHHNPPILDGFKVGIRRIGQLDVLTVEATSIDITYEACIPIDGRAPGIVDNETVVDGRTFAGLFTGKGAARMKGTARITRTGEEITVTGDGATSTLRQIGEGAADWPKLPLVVGPGNRSVLHSSQARWIADAAYKGGIRGPILEHVSFDGGYAVTTDTYRLHYADDTGTAEGMVPAQAIKLAAQSAGKAGRVHVVTSGNGWRVDTNHQADYSHQWYGKLYEHGDFPNWRQLIPSTVGTVPVVVNGSELVTVLDSLRKASADKDKPARFELNGPSYLVTVGDSSSVVSADVGDRPPREFAFNPRFLADLVRPSSGPVTLQFQADKPHLKPMHVVHEDGSAALLMPICVD